MPQSTTLGLQPVIHVPNYMDHYTFTDPWGIDGWVGHVGWPIADSLTTKWSPIQLAVWCRMGKSSPVKAVNLDSRELLTHISHPAKMLLCTRKSPFYTWACQSLRYGSAQCQVSEWVGFNVPSTHHRSFRRRVFPVDHLYWYWQPKKNNQETEHTNNTTKEVALVNSTTGILKKSRLREDRQSLV